MAVGGHGKPAAGLPRRPRCRDHGQSRKRRWQSGERDEDGAQDPNPEEEAELSELWRDGENTKMTGGAVEWQVAFVAASCPIRRDMPR